MSRAQLARVWPFFLARAAQLRKNRACGRFRPIAGARTLAGVHTMEPVAKLSRGAYVEALRAKLEEVLGRVADAVNGAPPGQVIAGSEEQVRDLLAAFRQQSYEMPVQMRVDAAEAALPPSAGPADR